MDIEKLFSPESIAVIGASGRPGSVGYIYLESLIKGGYRGRVHPINPRYDDILGLKCYGSIEELGEVDLAIIATNKSTAVGLLKDCSSVGVKAAVIPTGGFEEVGEEGAELERKVRRIAVEGDIALLGTNTLGLINNHADLQINFNPRSLPPKGEVSIISQSGGMGLSIISKMREEGLGLSKWIGVGNRTLLDFPEFLEYLATDESTRVIGVFMEGTERARDFCELASDVVPEKPVVVYKMGRSPSIDFLAVTHTGSGIGRTGAYRGAFRQFGVLTAESVRDLVARLKALSLVGHVEARRLGMFTYTAGPSIAAADLLGERFLFPQPSEEILGRIRALMKGDPPTVLKNPLDVDGEGYTADSYGALLRAFADDGFDILATVSTAGLLFPKQQLLEVKDDTGKPILHCHIADSFEMMDGVRDALQEGGIPVYSTAEELAAGLMGLSQYHQAIVGLESRGSTRPPILVNASDLGGRILDEHQSKLVLARAGLPVVEERVIDSLEELGDASRELGFPLVLKVLSDSILHKSDVGAVRVGITDRAELMESWNYLKTRWPHERTLVQRMVPNGVELIVGRVKDPAFGDIITLGVGGFLADLFLPSVGLCPCTHEDCLSMIDSMRPREVLEGYRGWERVSKRALATLMEKVSRMRLEGEEIMEMDLNPVIAKGDSFHIVDALIRRGSSHHR